MVFFLQQFQSICFTKIALDLIRLHDLLLVVYAWSSKKVPYAVIPVIMLFSTGHTIEVFKFAYKYF